MHVSWKIAARPALLALALVGVLNLNACSYFYSKDNTPQSSIRVYDRSGLMNVNSWNLSIAPIQQREGGYSSVTSSAQSVSLSVHRPNHQAIDAILRNDTFFLLKEKTDIPLSWHSESGGQIYLYPLRSSYGTCRELDVILLDTDQNVLARARIFRFASRDSVADYTADVIAEMFNE